VSRLNNLAEQYASHISTPWPKGLSGVERVIFLVYPPSDELKLRAYIDEFDIATRQAGHGWRHLDITDEFPKWMAGHKYRDKYLEHPELMAGFMEGRLTEFSDHMSDLLRQALSSATAEEVVAVSGVASLFGLASVSRIIEESAVSIAGKLLLFFPGDVENNNYRLLDARDGWNYMAHAITAE
jgi:hypothetical protein